MINSTQYDCTIETSNLVSNLTFAEINIYHTIVYEFALHLHTIPSTKQSAYIEKIHQLEKLINIKYQKYSNLQKQIILIFIRAMFL